MSFTFVSSRSNQEGIRAPYIFSLPTGGSFCHLVSNSLSLLFFNRRALSYIANRFLRESFLGLVCIVGRKTLSENRLRLTDIHFTKKILNVLITFATPILSFLKSSNGFFVRNKCSKGQLLCRASFQDFWKTILNSSVNDWLHMTPLFASQHRTHLFEGFPSLTDRMHLPRVKR